MMKGCHSYDVWEVGSRQILVSVAKLEKRDIFFKFEPKFFIFPSAFLTSTSPSPQEKICYLLFWLKHASCNSISTYVILQWLRKLIEVNNFILKLAIMRAWIYRGRGSWKLNRVLSFIKIHFVLRKSLAMLLNCWPTVQTIALWWERSRTNQLWKDVPECLSSGYLTCSITTLISSPLCRLFISL